MATHIAKPTGPAEIPGHESTTALARMGQQALAPQQYLPAVQPAAVEQAMMIGDLSQMTPEIRIAYYVATCQSIGLNALTRPFQALQADDGTIILYPDKGCAEQLRKRDRISLRMVSREYVEDLYIVTVEASTPDGRREEAEGIVVVMEAAGEWKEGTKRNGDKYRYKEEKLGPDGQPILKRLTGTAMANARMRCETKAKRRATLAICGLGMPDAGEGHPMRFDLQQGTFSEAAMDPSGDIVDVTPMRTVQANGKTRDDHIEDLTGRRPEPTPAVHPTQKALGQAINALHVAHRRDDDWITRYWNKMVRRLRVDTPAQLTPAQLQGLYTEAAQVYAKQATEAAQGDTSAADVPLDMSEPSAANLGNVSGLPDDASDAWRTTLGGLLGALEDMTLLHEAQSVGEDPDVSAEVGNALLTRVQQALDAQAEQGGMPF